MWELCNETPFAAERTFARDRDGAEVLLVVVKATFAIGPNAELTIADEQIPVARTPRYAGEPGRSSLVHDTDFALGRRTTDVLLVGHARARDERPVTALVVSVRIGVWEKRVAVFGDRRWERGLGGWRATDPEPFVASPLVYERAFGGIDRSGPEILECENPVGVGFGRPGGEGEPSRLPNLEDPAAPLQSPDDRPRPMALGPIAREWPARRRLAGTFDERWRRERRPLVPDDFDDAFWQSAPPDQRVSLEGGEEVELGGVSAGGPIHFTLPRLALSFRSRVNGRNVDHDGALHTVFLDPDRGRVTLVYQSALPCHHDIHVLERTVVRESEVRR